MYFVRNIVYDVSMTTKERLFAAAKNIYERDGLDALTIRAVGRKAGMSAMAIYRHFPDKNALIDALTRDGFDAWEAIVRKIDCDDPILWLKRAVASYADFALTDPHRFDAAFLLPASPAQTFPMKIETGRFSIVKCIIAQIEKAQTQGRLLDESPMQITLMISALAQGLVSMHRAGRVGSDEQFCASYQVAMDRLLTSFMKGPALYRNTNKTKNGK
ncbi:MAG: TetR/AcrR family transcriptional regulator [Alphaproteobacteria bacterium]|nr:TetR/AcrR family transcriptional regulator [Alphaproteobacteria bacterium]